MISFTRSLRLCLIDRALDFNGRGTRAEFWWFALFCLVLLPPAWAALMLPGLAPILGFLTPVVNLVILITMTTAAIRRLHDTDRSGWIVLLPVLAFIPVPVLTGMNFFTLFSGTMIMGLSSGMLMLLFIASLIFMAIAMFYTVILLVKPGTPGDNDYGPDPMESQYYNPGGSWRFNEGAFAGAAGSGAAEAGACGQSDSCTTPDLWQANHAHGSGPRAPAPYGKAKNSDFPVRRAPGPGGPWHNDPYNNGPFSDSPAMQGGWNQADGSGSAGDPQPPAARP